MNLEILARDNSGVAPCEIVFIPEGSHTITPSVNGQAKTITVNLPRSKGAQIAAQLNSVLARRLGENVRPHIGFDHQNGAAAAIPSGLVYRDGVGIVLQLDWTGKGRSAVEGRDYSYFSPAFLVDANNEPVGLPDKGEIGSLVNNPAFRNIPRIAASDAGGHGTDFESRAEAMVNAGEADCIADAYAAVAAADPQCYENYCESLNSAQSPYAQAVSAAASITDPLGTLKQRADFLIAAGQASNREDAESKIFSADDALYLACLKAGV